MDVLKKILVSSSILVLTACGAGGIGSLSGQIEPINPIQEYQAKDTSEILKPEELKQNDVVLIQGSTRLETAVIVVNSQLKSIQLKGRLQVQSSQSFHVDLEMIGTMNEKGESLLLPSELTLQALPNQTKIAAKALCLNISEAGFDCSSVVIDIFLKDGQKIYIHQIENHRAPVKSSPNEEATLPELEDETDSLNEQTETGRYVGTLTLEEIESALGEQKQEGEVKPPVGQEQGGAGVVKPPAKENGPQAIGAPFQGQLTGSEDFSKSKNKFVHLLRLERKRHFGTRELVYVLNRSAELSFQIAKMKMVVGDLSAERGGKIGTHRSHQNGLDADIGYLIKGANTFVPVSAKGRVVPKAMVKEQWELFKGIVKTGYIDRIFIHRDLKHALCRYAQQRKEVTAESHSGEAFETLRRLIPDTDHNTHYHLRIKCSVAQKRCRQMVEPPKTMGCP